VKTDRPSAETSEPRSPYEPPAIAVLGKVADLTGGVAGSQTA
jgi:hypothetical protein